MRARLNVKSYLKGFYYLVVMDKRLVTYFSTDSTCSLAQTCRQGFEYLKLTQVSSELLKHSSLNH